MNQNLETIRIRAIAAREKLSYANGDDQRIIARLDKIIRGAVLVKWMHLFAALFFCIFALFFLYLMYPDAEAMMLIAGFAAGGYAVCWIGVLVQIKIYSHAIAKVQPDFQTEYDTVA